MDHKDDTPMFALTVGEFRELMREEGKQELNHADVPQKEEKSYVYGLAGIRKLFNVSHATAQRYKDTIIKDAVVQCGRKIIVDRDKAIEMFNQNKK